MLRRIRAELLPYCARVGPQVAMQNSELPYITYRVVSSVPLSESGSLTRHRVQISLYDGGYEGATALAEAVVGALNHHCDDVIKRMVFENQTDYFGDELNIYGRIIDFFVFTNVSPQ